MLKIRVSCPVLGQTRENEQCHPSHLLALMALLAHLFSGEMALN
jgi:hypothetical protein